MTNFIWFLDTNVIVGLVISGSVLCKFVYTPTGMSRNLGLFTAESWNGSVCLRLVLSKKHLEHIFLVRESLIFHLDQFSFRHSCCVNLGVRFGQILIYRKWHWWDKTLDKLWCGFSRHFIFTADHFVAWFLFKEKCNFAHKLLHRLTDILCLFCLNLNFFEQPKKSK